MARVERIEVDGKVFRRYPDSPHAQHRKYFQGHFSNNENPIYLHRYIWEKRNGPIPEGHDVHHDDNDTLNNEPDNLVCLPEGDHRRLHADERRGQPASEKQRRHLESIRPLSAEWHRSEEGRQWHRLNAQRSWEDREPVVAPAPCEACGAEFETYRPEKARYCSITCRNRDYERKNPRPSRYKKLRQPEPRLCEVCGEEYQPLRRTARSLCSRKCRAKDIYRRKQQAS